MTISSARLDANAKSLSVRSPLDLRPSLILLALLLAVTIAVSGIAVLAILFIPGARAVGLVILGATLPIHAAVMLLVIHWRLRRAGTGWRNIGFTRPTVRILHLLWQIPTIVLALLAVQGIAFALMGEAPGSDGGGVESLVAGAGPPLVIAVFVGAALLTPLWEETVFRGVIHGGLRRRFGPLIASLLSAAVFAIAHGVPILLPYMLTLGLSLAYLREFRTTLWASAIMHAVLNTLATGGIVIALMP